MTYYLDRLKELGYQDDFIETICNEIQNNPIGHMRIAENTNRINMLYSMWRFYLLWNTVLLNELAEDASEAVSEYGKYTLRRFRQEKNKHGITTCSDSEKSLYKLIHQDDDRARDTTVLHEFLILVVKQPKTKEEYQQFYDNRVGNRMAKHINL